jgi:hypothetical protein
VSAAGGAPTDIPLVLDTAWARTGLRNPPNLNVLWPYHLPRADLALVVPDGGSSIGVIDLKTGRFRPLLRGNRPYYLPTGHIVFYSGPEEVSVVPFDVDRLEVTGPAVPITDDVLKARGKRRTFHRVAQRNPCVRTWWLRPPDRAGRSIRTWAAAGHRAPRLPLPGRVA